MIELETSEIDFISNIIEDIDYLYELGSSGRQIASEARMASVIIRRLILDKELQRAASKLKQKLFLMLPPELPDKRELQDKGILYAHTALSIIGNSQYYGFRCDAVRFYLDVREDIGFKRCTLDEFVKQSVLYYHGSLISRADLLRYAANKDGGAHHGDKYVRNEDIITKAKGCIAFSPLDDGKFNLQVELSRLLNVHEEVYPSKNSVNLIHLEILSSARLISHCPVVQTLKSKLIHLID